MSIIKEVIDVEELEKLPCLSCKHFDIKTNEDINLCMSCEFYDHISELLPKGRKEIKEEYRKGEYKMESIKNMPLFKDTCVKESKCDGCKKKEKIRVSEAEIVVHGTKEKPYYEIKYRKLGCREYNIGYSSCYLDYVFNWLEEEFEIVSVDDYKKNKGC
ncbi:MAG: hypothetical protein K2N51_07765 [Lachnospiraceae bacterium]|nr:hypothetical protein [Lachnospiraceae bacterium]